MFADENSANIIKSIGEGVGDLMRAGFTRSEAIEIFKCITMVGLTGEFKNLLKEIKDDKSEN